MQKHFVAVQVWLATRKKAKGQSLAEYGLILALIAVLCIGALTTMGTEIQRILTDLGGAIAGVTVTTN